MKILNFDKHLKMASKNNLYLALLPLHRERVHSHARMSSSPVVVARVYFPIGYFGVILLFIYTIVA